MRHKPCRYCGVAWPCTEHHVDCPSEINLWPVTNRETAAGMCCMDCGEEFRLGEHYTTRSLGASVVSVVCLGCGALAVAE